MEAPLKILLVDDDESDPVLFEILSEHTGHRIRLETLSNDQQAIDYLEGRSGYADRAAHPLPDLVVLDLNMPLATGFDFLDWRKSSAAFASLPVVVFSGSTNKNDKDKAMALGACAYCPKPSDLEKWKTVIKEILDLGEKSRLVC
jgi:CheY-like chemotaxis protein